MLNIENISAGYGDLQVLFDVSLHVNDGECVALVGSNGAGKTSLLSVIGGHLPVMNGGVQWNGTELLDLPAMARAELGIAHIPQGRGILGTMNVMDNLLLGGYCKRVKARRQQNIEQVFGLFPKLRERQNQIAGSLSGGEQQMLAMGRALMSKPKLLMLDEPSMGLAPILVEQIFDIIRELHAAGTTILLVEQNAQAALSVADRAYVLETGKISLTGTGAELMASDAVRKAYLGG